MSYASNAEQLRQGKVPVDNGTLAEINVGLDSLEDFITLHYLEDYIPSGGSKIKFITGRPGSGKTHLARRLRNRAENMGYLCVSFSAREVWLHDFREVYLEIFRQCGFETLLSDCARQIIRDMGYDPAVVGDGRNFMDYLTEQGEGDALSKGEIRTVLRRYFTRNPLLDNCFAGCCSLLTGAILGHPVLEPVNRELLLAYLRGDKSVKLSQLRALGLSPAGITRYNARYLLRSLTEIVRLSGRPGLLVTIDDMETLLDRAADSPRRYTKLRREDSYESIRQLIDDIDSMRHILFLLCFDRELMDNESYGLKSYQALWLRIQNEVVSTRFNRFADIIDMDRYADEAYDEATLLNMSRRLSDALGRLGVDAAPLDAEAVRGVIERSRFGSLGLPYLINRTMLEGGEADV
ncbi:MAG: DUF2791 family P-loop domain-containing protein [Oscillospiraceae bacterium]|nr:DUF2791 family P-loop domain-containing protein [Oscillospiraceae bacterium]